MKKQQESEFKVDGLGESLIPPDKKLKEPNSGLLPPTLQIVRPDGAISNKNSPSMGRKELDKAL